MQVVYCRDRAPSVFHIRLRAKPEGVFRIEGLGFRVYGIALQM